MISELQQQIDAADIVSFDMFDTLVHRGVQEPHHVYQLTQIALRHEVITKKIPTIGTAFTALRCEAEVVARGERLKYHGDKEVTLDEIYTVLGEMLGVTREDLKFVLNHELKIEKLLIYADPVMKEALKYAQSIGKRVIIISDMYLQEEHLRGLLNFGADYHGIENVKIYSSSDYRVSKANGKLYDIVIEELKTTNILHIGDNLQSDIAMAEAKGLKTFHYDSLKDQQSLFIFDTTLSTGLTAGIVNKLYTLNSNRSFFNRVGVSIFGPLVAGYIIWILKKLRHTEYDTVLFFARDTYVPYNIITKHLRDCEDSRYRLFTNLPPLEYLYVSRAATTLPALFDFDVKKLTRMISGREERSIKEWLELYGIADATKYIGEIQAAGFDSIHTIINSEDKRIAGLVQSLYAAVQHNAAEENKSAQEYLNKFLKKNLAVVDIGWSGSLQQNLSKIFNLRESCYLDGYYFNLWTHREFSRKSLHDRYSSYLQEYKENLYSNLPELLHSGGMELLECVLSAPHGTTLGYLNGEPILEEVEPSEELNKIKQIQDGIEEFFDELVPILRHFSVDSLSSLDWTRSFFRMVEFPTLEEATALGDLHHSNGAGALTGKMSPIAPKLSLDFSPESKEYIVALGAACWKQAFILRNG